MFEQFVHDWALHAATLVDGLAALLILAAILPAIARSAAALARPDPAPRLNRIRVRISQWLALALEFLIGSDIIRTAVSPDWRELGQLAAIVVLRVVIEYTLMHEVDEPARNEGN
jgi:uncharacterized membrane protein